MSALIEAKDLTKLYGPRSALDRVGFTVRPGCIVGLIGPNGAGKTTLVRAILGLTQCEGRLSVFGLDPYRERAAVMREACFIADVALLPSWLRVGQAVDFLAGVHPRFRRERAQSFLDKARVARSQRIHDLSKGTKTQVHLALAMAIDARLLVLDEPTLGLDPLARRDFYSALVDDYMDETRTLLITTHQVEELENLLTDVLFIDRGRIVLDASVEDIGVHYAVVAVRPDCIETARRQKPFYEQSLLGKTMMYFERPRFEILTQLGELRLPGVADLFVALMSRRGA